jgi:hypothetical protein
LADNLKLSVNEIFNSRRRAYRLHRFEKPAIGFFNNRNLPVTRLLPKDKEPVGWGNVLHYLSSEEFRNGVDNTDFVIVQIDTNECADWNEGLKHIGDDASRINGFIDQIIPVLIKNVGAGFYAANKDKIIFAICVHEIECWLLPFNANQPAHYSKIAGCANAIEKIAQKNGYSIHQKNYQNGKHYDDLSKEMKNNKALMQKTNLNPGLKFFIDSLSDTFPKGKVEEPTD